MIIKHEGVHQRELVILRLRHDKGFTDEVPTILGTYRRTLLRGQRHSFSLRTRAMVPEATHSTDIQPFAVPAGAKLPTGVTRYLIEFTGHGE